MSTTAESKKIWTIMDLVTWGTSYLSEKKFSDARLTIELLLAHVLQFQRIQLYTRFDRPLDETELTRFKELLKRRIAQEPVQYILGETEFMGLPFKVDRNVLIPRPDTEVLVEATLEQIKSRFSDNERLFALDIGTGSGCIAISLAKRHSSLSVSAIDNSEKALTVARENADLNGVREKISFECADILNGYSTDKKFHCIVSNPPYISTKEFDLLSAEVREFEPISSLTENGDGLEFFRVIARDASPMLLPNGFVVVEHAYNQSDAVQNIFKESGWGIVQARMDYGGNYRCIIAHRQ